MLDGKIGYDEEDDNGELIRPLKEFLNNDTEARIKANPEFSDWCAFRDEVLKDFGTEAWTVADVFDIASFRNGYDAEDLNLLGSRFQVPNSLEGTRRKCLGFYFKANIDKVFGNYKFIANGKKDGRNAYSFKPLNNDEEEDNNLA